MSEQRETRSRRRLLAAGTAGLSAALAGLAAGRPALASPGQGLFRDAEYLATVGQLLTTAIPGDVALVGGYHEEHDGGGGVFVRVPAAEAPGPPDGGTVLDAAAAPGSRWVRVRQTGGAVDLRWWGVGTPGHEEASQALTSALALAGGAWVWIPAGSYRLEGVEPPGGSRIEASPEAKLTGSNAGATLFTTTGLTGEIHLRGGDWRDCETVWQHAIGTSQALVRSTFEEMRIGPGVTTGFSIESAAGVVWRRIYFVGAGTGITFEASNSYFNANTIESCTFQGFAGRAIALRGAHQRAQCVRNTIRDCWFETDRGAPRSGSAVFAECHLHNLSVTGCYFERVGGLEPVIDFQPGQYSFVDSQGQPATAQSQQHGLVVERCYFHPGAACPVDPPAGVPDCDPAALGPPPSYMIRTQGNVGLTTRDCTAFLGDGQRLVGALSTATPFDLRLDRNHLVDASGLGRPYHELLFHSEGQRVHYSSVVSHGVEASTNHPRRYRAAAVVDQPLRLDPAEPAPWVSAGRLYYFARSLHQLSGGLPGQLVQLVYDGPPGGRHLVKGAQRLSDGAILLAGGHLECRPGTNLTLRCVELEGHRLWVEAARAEIG